MKLESSPQQIISQHQVLKVKVKEKSLKHLEACRRMPILLWRYPRRTVSNINEKTDKSYYIKV
jgi:hypothetical protein